MNLVKKSAKTKEEAKELVLCELQANEEDVCLSFEEIKGGLFKGNLFECSGYLKKNVVGDVEEFLRKIIENMGLEVSFEVTTKDEVTTIKIYSSNSPLLIGKNGQNLDALSVLARQFVKNVCNNGPRIVLDVADYKDRQIKRIEKLAKNLARDVLKTKVDIEMDNMNSYERRAVHNVLSEFKDIKTESVGEEPNRHVVIKYNG